MSKWLPFKCVFSFPPNQSLCQLGTTLRGRTALQHRISGNKTTQHLMGSCQWQHQGKLINKGHF